MTWTDEISCLFGSNFEFENWENKQSKSKCHWQKRESLNLLRTVETPSAKSYGDKKCFPFELDRTL